MNLHFSEKTKKLYQKKVKRLINKKSIQKSNRGIVGANRKGIEMIFSDWMKYGMLRNKINHRWLRPLSAKLVKKAKYVYELFLVFLLIMERVKHHYSETTKYRFCC